MAFDLNDAWGWIQKLISRVSRLESGAMLENSSITNGRMRFIGGLLLIDSGGTLQVVGTATVDGTQRVTGRLEGSGVFDWSGPLFLRGNTGVTGILQVTGATTLAGNLNVTGTTTLAGDVTLNNDLTLGSGRIVAGPVTIDKLGPAGGRIASAGQMIVEGASGVRILGTLTTSAITALGDVIVGDLFVTNLDVSGAKNFRMPHPTKPEHWLRHGSTESPVSGTEYTGRLTLDENGEGEIALPEYFEALNKPRNRTVQVTPIGRPFPVGAGDVLEGRVTVYGEPGREVFWLVKAERYGGDFPLEEQIPPEPFSED